MKFIKGILSLVIIMFLVCVGGVFFTKGSSNEAAAIFDQLNPLVQKGEVYVKTKAPDAVNEYGTASYQQLAADSNGKTRQISFNGLSTLKENRYLKLTNKGAHVETYQEVNQAEVPAAALEQIN